MRHKPTVLFVSMAPASVGHVYRVTNHAECFERLGYRTHVVGADVACAAISALPDLRVIIVFRPLFDEQFIAWRALASARGVPFLADLDDLTFDLDVLDAGEWHYWLTLSLDQQAHWRDRFLSQRRALQKVDGAIASTTPLARSLSSLVPRCWVWPNGFGQLSWSIAMQCRERQAADQISSGEEIVIGYASGTPTHGADFAVAVPALLQLLSQSSHLRLEVLGSLELSAYPSLKDVSDQIRCVPLVPYAQLPTMLSRFDINLAPLDLSSRFCAAKSELKFFEAAAVGVPTVASPTPPFKEVIQQAGNGFTAATTEEWTAGLSDLVQQPLKRKRLASRAFRTVRQRFSPGAQRRDLQRLLGEDLLAVE